MNSLQKTPLNQASLNLTHKLPNFFYWLIISGKSRQLHRRRTWQL
jgi:hypothetical protein